MALRGARQEQSRSPEESRQYLVAVRDGTHFAFPAEIVRGLGRGSEAGSSAQSPLSRTDLLCHFPGTSASGHPARQVLCGRRAAEQCVLVDEVIGLTEVAKEQIRPLPAQFTGPERLWFSGLFLFRDTAALLVNPEWLLVQGQPVPITSGVETPPRPPVLRQEAAQRSDRPATAHEAKTGGSRGDLLDGLTLEEATDAEDTPWAEL